MLGSRQTPPATGDVIDLSMTSEFLLELLEQPLLWRQRLVETVTLASPYFARVEGSYQIEFPRDLIQRFLGGRHADEVRVLLPLATRHKHQLFGFDLHGPDGKPAVLARRRDIAAWQAEFLARLAATSPAGAAVSAGLPDPLLEALSVFTPRRFLDMPRQAHGDLVTAVTRWLGEGLRFPVPRACVQRWLETLAQTAALLARPFGQEDCASSTENVLVALPHVDPAPLSIESIDQIIAGYVKAVHEAHAGGDAELLDWLATLGRRWVMVVETQVPLWRPSIVRVVEDRRIELQESGAIEERFDLGAASSYHLEVRVIDTSVELVPDDVELSTIDGTALPELEDLQVDNESLALYDSRPGEVPSLRVRLRLRPARYLRRASTAIEVLTWTASLVLITGTHAVATIGLLVVPATFAVALLLTREPGSLSARLMSGRRSRVLLALAMLWLAVLYQLVVAEPPAYVVNLLRRLADFVTG